MKSVDYLIVGHGLAGATLAWQLEKLGQSVAVVDREEANSASRVAAGLISPITGQRNAVSHRFDEFWPEAKELYRSFEETTGSKFLYFDRTLKVVERIDDSTESLTLSPPYRSLSAKELCGAARLDAITFLNASREWLREHKAYFHCDLDLQNDITIQDSLVEIPRLDLSAGMVVFCQGIDAQSNAWLSGMSFEPAKGEILEVVSDELAKGDTVLGDIWVVPTSSTRCVIGTTYERDFKDALPTEAGKASILQRLGEIADCDASVVDHRAAIRPILSGRLPKIGVVHPQVGFFNGLGSKGTLRAPFVSRQLAEHLVLGRQVDAEFWLELSGEQPNRRLTDVAQAAVLQALEEGAIAIDATVGNGFDTLFLSQAVGKEGHVYGIDIQDEALERTTARLAASCAGNVTLRCGSHAELDEFIPQEYHGRVAAVMFNLGYLPRGDKAITTATESTLDAIKKSARLLRSGGVISIVAYTGHSGGLEETHAIESLLCDADFRALCSVTRPPTRPHAGPPRLYFLSRN